MLAVLYQRPWYERVFLWTASSRAVYGDQARLRRSFRLAAAAGLAIGAARRLVRARRSRDGTCDLRRMPYASEARQQQDGGQA